MSKVVVLILGLAWLGSESGCTASDPTELEARASTKGGGAEAGAQRRAEAAFTAFESGQVRPIVVSADRRFVYATNTPDNRVEIFRIEGRGLRLVGSVPVGLEPVAVAERKRGELWVVNHLSDSVSIVDVSAPERAQVVRTLLVGDEPRDIVFAGADGDRAFITTAHRGQNTGRDPQLTTPGVGRADVWVFDARRLGATLGGSPLTVITLFADTPRALAVTPDRRTVYAAAFQSGNRSTTLNERIITPNGFLPPPFQDPQGVGIPPTGLIVRYRADPTDQQLHWLDNIGRRWDEQVKLSLPDKDVFAIDATATPPAAIADRVFSGVGTVLFNMAVNPVSGVIYVANTEARNEVRFEGHNASGPGQGAPPGSVRGHFSESRITAIDPATGSVRPRHLNKHLDYSRDGTPAEAARSLAQPTGMAITPDGATLYVAALGSSKLGVFATAQLEADTFVPSREAQIALTGGGPTGLALDAGGGMLYVLTRFDNSISIVDPRVNREVGHVAMYNPEPPRLVAGRRFLYDATLSSSHGDSSCAGCHVFGDLDSLAWDLGDPDGAAQPIPGPFTFDASGNGVPMIQHSLKGPMTTQSLRGMANHGPMHWRGDRTGGTDAMLQRVLPSAQPDTGTFDEVAAFKKFNVAFRGLLGRDAELTDAQMQAFTDFALQLSYPPNPIRNLDNSLTAEQQAGRDLFFSRRPDGRELESDGVHNCNGCHVLDPRGNAAFGVAKPGFFGSDGHYSFESEFQFMKVPHLRNQYQKVGMFGMAETLLPGDETGALAFLSSPYNTTAPQGDQIRGFGFLHDGSVDSVFRFLSGTVFVRDPHDNPGGFPVITDPSDPAQAERELRANLAARRQAEAFVMAFDSNLAPIVGQQLTIGSASGAAEAARVDLLEARAAAGECELVVHATLGTRSLGWLYQPRSRTFLSSLGRGARWTEPELRRLRLLSPLTFTAVPVGSGRRLALDRDLDGELDGDEDRDRDRDRDRDEDRDRDRDE
jgi:DNA-binding beta-propeller fold protein YncE